jgi:hypothetical protein
MASTVLALFVRLVVLYAVVYLICAPARRAAERWLPEGQLKRLLLRELGEKSVHRKP